VGGVPSGERLAQCGEVDQARQIYDRLARQPDLSPARRGWAYARSASLRLETAPVEALAILDEAVRLESPTLEQQVALLGRLYVAGAPRVDLDSRLDQISARNPDRALDVHGRLLREVRRQLDDGRFAAADTLLGVLEKRVGPDSAVRVLETEVRRTREMVRQGLRCHEIAEAMTQYLDAAPPRWWGDEAVTAHDRDRLVGALQRLDRKEGSLEFVRAAWSSSLAGASHPTSSPFSCGGVPITSASGGATTSW
jgi:hypothetical protein